MKVRVRDVERLSLQELTAHCTRERNRYVSEGESDTRFCFELMRRALAGEDQRAWDALYEKYTPLVRAWVLQNSAFGSLPADVDEIVHLAFYRFWRNVPPEKFDNFDTLAALLKYLQLCTSSTIADEHRRTREHDRLISMELIGPTAGSTNAVDVWLLEKSQRERFWDEIQGFLKGEEERLVVMSYFVQGLKPQQIHAEHSDHFPDVKDVYRIKKRVLTRLRRADALRRWS